MIMTDLPPFIPFFVAAALVAFCKGWVRTALLVFIPLCGALNVYYLGEGTLWQCRVFGIGLSPLQVDTLSRLFGYLFHVGALLAPINSQKINRVIKSPANTAPRAEPA